MAVLGLRFCARAFSNCGKWGPLFIAARGPLTIAASLVAEHRLQMRRLSNCGSRAQLLLGMWESSQTRARTRVPCTGRQILNHCATREALYVSWWYWLHFKNVALVIFSTLLVLNVAEILNPTAKLHLAGTCHCAMYLARKSKNWFVFLGHITNLL